MTERTREEVLADLQPVRLALAQIGEHLNDEHGVKASMRSNTDPALMLQASPPRFRAWCRRYGVKLDWDDPALTDDEVAQAIADRQAQCSVEGCPGVDALFAEYSAGHELRRQLRAELPMPDVKEGGVQTVRPRGLDAEAMSGLVGRFTG